MYEQNLRQPLIQYDYNLGSDQSPNSYQLRNRLQQEEISYRQYQTTHIPDRENQEILANAKRQMALDLIAMVLTSVSYSIGMGFGDLCSQRIGPWLELFIIYQSGISFLNLAQIFAIQGHIIEQIGLPSRVIYEESKILTVLKLLTSLVLIYILIIGNQMYFSQQNNCLLTNKLFFYTLMFVLIYCYFQLMIFSLVVVAFILLIPIFLYFWCTRRQIDSNWVPSSRDVLIKLKKTRFGKFLSEEDKKEPGKQIFESESEQFCSICLGNYTMEDYITILPCDERHAFHTGCIELWLNKNCICPLCKKPVEL
ncbi:ring finger related protein [Stylonychia lemnae]|uniref:RING-type E3 ubiquitin transferase n=1 Tax=Stylonychia lemnae TaxID=5949 RepID=A0A078ABW1_STYLE|nr:ring finger related protein [Stylonychia lemnae]|eukprot:CDW79684.1 ring finger related protein [Stylonychia lemnae]